MKYPQFMTFHSEHGSKLQYVIMIIPHIHKNHQSLSRQTHTCYGQELDAIHSILPFIGSCIHICIYIYTHVITIIYSQSSFSQWSKDVKSTLRDCNTSMNRKLWWQTLSGDGMDMYKPNHVFDHGRKSNWRTGNTRNTRL